MQFAVSVKTNEIKYGSFALDCPLFLLTAVRRGDMFAYMDIAFDRFLKLNNQSKGTDSYQDIVLWLYNRHKKELSRHQQTHWH